MELLETYQITEVEHTEEELIDAAKTDPRNFEPLYRLYFKRIFLFVFHRVADKALAKDITSQVFLKALSSIGSYSHQGLPFSSWLFRIAINECNGHFRKKSVTHTVVLDEHHFHLLTDEISLGTDDDRKRLRAAIKGLKHEEVEMIELRFFEEMKFQQIAEVMGITENNAKVRMYRILDKLREKLKKS